jgi:Fic family protein
VDQGVVPGEIRRHSVGVGRYRGAPPKDCEYLLDRLCAWLEGPDFLPSPALDGVLPFLKALCTHLYLAWIHPFGDGNGRTARLIEFQILVASGVPSPAAHLLSNHYNQTRAEYYRHLDHSSRSGGDVLPFLLYATQGFADGLRQQIDVVRGQQWDVAWRNYVHEQFSGQKGAAADRRRRLVLDLSLATDAVPLQKLPEISPRLAAAYARKTLKTLTRDVNELVRANLIEKSERGYRARRETILAFLPVTGGSAAGGPLPTSPP